MPTSPWRPVAFVPVAELDRALAFYLGPLGLTLRARDDYGAELEAAGTHVRLAVVPGHTPARHTIFGFHVPDVRGALAELPGVSPLVFGLPGQGADGVWAAPGGVDVAWFFDSEGNVLSFSTG